MKPLLLYLFLFICSDSWLFAQTFEYTENKGQWNREVLYKGELHNGAFFLKANGYRVVQHNTSDLDKVKSSMTGHRNHHHGLTATTSANFEDLPDQEERGSTDMESTLVLRSHAYDVVFAGANAKVATEGQKKLDGYSNYFIGKDSSNWASEVTSYGEVTYRNMYPGIDVRYYSDEGFLKYDLVAAPNAPVERVLLTYIGTQGLRLDKGELVIKTSVGEVRERAPYCYQLVNGSRKQVECRYELIGNSVRFKLKGYNPALTLVIDPTLVFSTFTGSTADNWGYTATFDGAGNAYAGGIAFGTGYPVTSGANQTTWRGGINTGEGVGFDIAITKFNANGTRRIYATYLGGTGNEQPHSLVVDGANNLVMAGRTTSADYPTTISPIGPGGQWDNVITKLNAAGTALVGSISIGGRQDDGVNIKHKYSQGGPSPVSLQQNYGDDARSEVVLDRSGNILVASCTRSPDFPVTPGAFQSSLNGQQDALLMKFTPNLNALIFASYLGGSADDAAYVLAIGNSNNIFVGGGTVSINFPGNKSNTVGPTFNGGSADGFIAEIDPLGISILRSTFIGTPGGDQVYGVQFDTNGFLYLMGTSNNGNFPVRNAPFSQPGGKQFIAKLLPDLSQFVYSTVFGTNSVAPNISPTAFLVDRCENVYVSGWGGATPAGQGLPSFPSSGTTNLTTTADAVQPQTDGKDFYFFVLEKDAASQLFGSFFGQLNRPDEFGDHVDGGTSRFDAVGVIYQGICANCGGGQFPTTPGVVGPSNPSGRCNQALLKVSFDLSGVRGGVKPAIDNVDGDTTACVPAMVRFRDTVGIARTYEWDFGDGTSIITGSPSVAHMYTNVGNYRVRLIAVDSTKCFPRDTSYANISIREDSASLAATATKLSPCESNSYRFDNLSIAVPTKPFTSNSFTWLFGDNSAPLVTGIGSVTHQYAAPGTYNVRLVLTDTNYCNAPDTLSIPLRVSPLVDALFTTPLSGCAPYDAVFTNTSLGGQQFFWSFGDGTTSTAVNPIKRYTNTGTYTIKLIAIDSNTCNIIDSVEQTIIVSDKPNADFSFSPNPPEENIITTFTNLSDVVPLYKWLFGDGDSLFTTRRDTLVRHQYNETGTYNACIIAINQFGCPDTLCRPIPAIVSPLVNVVSAFTPNGDGINDRAVVFGFGIQRLNFRIYNRWGALMYETSTKNTGWDGRFRGKDQPMDAYGYTLEAELVSGEKVKMSGSITLIR